MPAAVAGSDSASAAAAARAGKNLVARGLVPGPQADVLGQGALTSPGHFRNAAHPIARPPTARNRAIAANVPSNAVRSRRDHHALDIHGSGTERAARTPGRELLDALTDDQHSGPRRKRPQFAITKHRIFASDADAATAWNVSRFPRNRRETAEDAELQHGC